MFERGPGEPAQGFAAGAGGGQHGLQSSFQPQPLRFSHLVILQLSEIPLYLVFFNWRMQPPDITLRHQGVSKNKQKKMENMKGYKGTAKMTEYSFVKLCNNNNIHL